MTGLGRIAVALSLLVALWPGSAFAQATKAGVVTALEGNVTAARTTSAQPVSLKFKDDVFVNDRVVTGDRSLARLLLGGKAVVTIRERSALTITEVPGRSTIDLDSGKIAVAVAKDRMQPGEQIEVKTPNAVAAVRGTVFVVEVIRASASAADAQGGVTSVTSVLDGSVTMIVGAQQFTVGPNNFFSVTGTAVSSGIMSPAQRAQATSGFSQSGMPTVSGGQGEAKLAAWGTTVATFTNSTPPIVPPPATPPPPTIPQTTVQNVPQLPGGTKTFTSTSTESASIESPPSSSPSSGPPPPGNKPAGILIFGDYPSKASLQTTLTNLGRTVVMNTTTLPADLSSFGTIWQVAAFVGLSQSDQTALANFLALGRGVHLTGERPCCDSPLNDSLTQFVRSVVVGGANITVGRQGDINGPYTFNSNALGGITTTPNTLTTWVPSAPGGLAGVSGANVLVTGAGGVPVGAVWGPQDLVNDAGRLTLLMDVNWFDNNEPDVVANIQNFIDDQLTTMSLSGSFFRSTSERLDSSSDFLTIQGFKITSSSSDPLLWFNGSTLTTPGQFVRMSYSDVSTNGSFVRAENGTQIIQTAAAEPFVSMQGGSLAAQSLFDLSGRASATAVDAATGLTLGTDRPLQPGAESPVFDADGGASVRVVGSAYRIDTALLEATAPLLNLQNGTTVTTGDHAVDLVGRSTVSIPNDAVSMVTLRAAGLTVASGHLVNVAGGSVLNIAGNLVSLADGSTLNILNGLLLNVSGGSSATIGRSLVSFSGVGNLLNVSNSIAPTALINGIPVSGPVDSFRIDANAIAGAGSGTIRINGVALTPTTPLSSLTGSLVAVQSGGTVKVGK
jgi:hypothetical protein